MRWSTVSMVAWVAACTPASSLEGPGLDDDGELVTDAPGPFVVVATHTQVAKGERKAFNDHVAAVDEQLPGQAGFVASALRAQIWGRERWTLTVWADHDALNTFVVEGAHARAMQDAARVIDGLHTALWEVPRGDWPPTWDDALAELDEVEPDPAFP